MYGNPWIERIQIPTGDAGTWVTVRAMVRLAREGAEEPVVQQAAQEAARGADEPRARLYALRRWLEFHTRFTYDPGGVELVRSPTAALLEIQHTGVVRGDCDDVATLGASMALALGFVVRYRVLGWALTGPYSHVLAEAWDGRNWIDLDVTRPKQLGISAPPVREAALAV